MLKIPFSSPEDVGLGNEIVSPLAYFLTRVTGSSGKETVFLGHRVLWVLTLLKLSLNGDFFLLLILAELARRSMAR